MPPIEVFLSHANQDRSNSSAPCPYAHTLRYSCILQPQHILGAQQWQNEILGALQRCDWFVVLLSPDAINSMWVKREVAFALEDPRYEDRIIPLTYRECDLKSLQWLTLFQMVSFTGDFTAGCRNLLKTWVLV